jgi:hypothetical protein
MQNEQESAVEKALATLASATPPEGMEARIQQRLRYHSSGRGSAEVGPFQFSRNWWRGMLTGAAAATLFCGALSFSIHTYEARIGNLRTDRAVAREHTPAPAIATTSATRSATPPCPQRAFDHKAKSNRAPNALRTESEPLNISNTAEDELTAQERRLVRLTRVADPKQLSGLSFEARSQLDQQETAAFQKFFTPPPPPPDLGVNE